MTSAFSLKGSKPCHIRFRLVTAFNFPRINAHLTICYCWCWHGNSWSDERSSINMPNMPSKHGRHQKFHELLVKNVNSTFGSKSWRYPWKELLGDEAPALWHLVGHPPQVTHFNKNWGIKCQSHDRRCSLFHDGKANSLRKGSQPNNCWSPMFQQDHHVIHKRIAGTSSMRQSKISSHLKVPSSLGNGLMNEIHCPPAAKYLFIATRWNKL